VSTKDKFVVENCTIYFECLFVSEALVTLYNFTACLHRKLKYFQFMINL